MNFSKSGKFKVATLIVSVCALVGLFMSGIFDARPTISVDKNCSIAFTDKRPNPNDTTILACIPAAYTEASNIVGHYSTGKRRQGTSDSRYTTIRLDNGTYFQQATLVRNGKSKTFSDSRYRFRRALCLKDKEYSIVHSSTPIKLTTFSQQLKDYDYAWNLDMGTYAYGWVRDNGYIRHLGLSTFWNKHNQSNWIVIRRI